MGDRRIDQLILSIRFVVKVRDGTLNVHKHLLLRVVVLVRITTVQVRERRCLIHTFLNGLGLHFRGIHERRGAL